MNQRQEQLVTILSNNRNDKIITSAALAKRLNVTNRTIKSDMVVVAQAFENNGAKLVGIRNKGYTLTITDEEKFFAYIIKFNLKGDSQESRMTDNGELRIYSARRIIGSENGVRVEEIADSINYNRTYVSELLKWCNIFFESFGLKMKSSSNTGKIVVGSESNKRMAMVELIATHYHLVNYVKETNDEFSKWFECEEEERNEIRHRFLKVLRESGYSLSDSNTQRAAMYLILAYHRFVSGRGLHLPEKWMNEVEALKIHQLSLQILEALPEKYQILKTEREEAAFLTILLLVSLDVRIEKYDDEIIRLVEKELALCCNSVKDMLEGYGFQLDQFEKQTLENMLVPVVLSNHYHVDGHDKFNYKNEALGLASPIDMYFAYQIDEILEKKINYRSNRTNLSMFSLYTQILLYSRKYPIKKMKLLSTATFGSAFGQRFDQEIMKRYSDFIESIDDIELYEFRRLNPSDYDGFLVDLFFINDAYSGADANGYNYSLPAIPTLNRMGEEFEADVYDNLLINAYQFKDYLPKPSDIKIIEEYKFGSEELLFQSLSLMHANSFESAKTMWEAFGKRQDKKSMIFNDTVVICADSCLCRDKALELYCLKTPGIWKERKFNYVLFCSLELDHVLKIKALETVLRILTESNDYSLLKQDPISCFEHVIRMNLRKNKKDISL